MSARHFSILQLRVLEGMTRFAASRYWLRHGVANDSRAVQWLSWRRLMGKTAEEWKR